VNGVTAQIGRGASNKFGNKRGHKKTNKSSSIIYYCFIYNYVEHKIYNYPHKDVAHIMFKEKATTIAPKKEVIFNMVLVVTTHS